MSQEQADQTAYSPDENSGAAAVEKSRSSANVKKSPGRSKLKQLPPFKVLLHNDSVNDMEHVILVILKITPLSMADAESKMWEAHRAGVSLLLVTHKERAELYVDQFRSCNLTATIEPDE